MSCLAPSSLGAFAVFPYLICSLSRLFDSVLQKGMPLIGLYFCFLPFPSTRVYWFSCPMYVQCAVPAAGTIFSCSLVLSSGHCHPPVLLVIAVNVILSPFASGHHDACPTAIRRRASSASPCSLRCPPFAHRPFRTVCRHSPVPSCTSASAA